MAAELSELEHSGRAAESLYVTQSAVSQRLERSGGSSLLATVDLTGGSIR